MQMQEAERGRGDPGPVVPVVRLSYAKPAIASRRERHGRVLNMGNISCLQEPEDGRGAIWTGQSNDRSIDF
jgi:hypothetical protein